MEHIDWFIMSEDSNASGEDLIHPYAWLNGRVYSRGEFERLRDRTDDEIRRGIKAVYNIDFADKQLFFHNLDFIQKNKERIYADRSFGEAGTIDFSFAWHYSPFMNISYSFPIAVILRLWENGFWRVKCDECGNDAYQYKIYYRGGYCYCPHCDTLNVQSAKENDSIHLRKIYEEYYHKSDKENVTASLNIGRHVITFSNETDKGETAQECAKVKKDTDFRAMSAKWRKEYDEVPQEEIDARILFDAAKRHGEKMASFYSCLDDIKKFYSCKFTTPVQKFLNRLKGEKEEIYDEADAADAFDTYRCLRNMGTRQRYWLDRDCNGGKDDETREVECC